MPELYVPPAFAGEASCCPQSRPREGALNRILEALDLPLEAIDRAQEFARHPVSDGTLPPDDRAEQRKAALRLAHECGRAVAHCCLAFIELQAGGWEE
ncbi:MAG TPA: hypothetical protein VHQ90_26225 [Thermoanaerobaculia bacterium]|nr:hypothetical protein [Thermoanaerobaculia bacterium]